ncbi:MAG: glycerophosphodiester phosphodiesterase [Alphaproteobacteria bacterium]|nr:MAG: glycerophosphodiester phosphodiesterase [Alphaproteobacteria bacterium]
MGLHPYLQPGEFIPFAHRGGSLEAPENTMAAFQAAVDLGFKYIETDVIVTRDNSLVCFHDLDLARLTGQPGLSTDLTREDLRGVKVKGSHPVPYLEELLSTWPDIHINIEPKNDRAVVPLIETIRRLGAQDRVCLGTFPAARLKQIRRLGGDWLCTALGQSDVVKLVLAGYKMPFFRIDGHCAQMPARFQGRNIITKGLLRAAEARGVKVHAWTINDEDEMERLIDVGVHGIMTDRPSLLKKVMERRGMWPDGAGDQALREETPEKA